MSTLQPRTGLILPDDGGPGGDDTVNVTTQVSDSIDYLSNAVGIFDYTGSQPSTGNFIGRLIRNTATGEVWRYIGSGWDFVQDSEWQTAWKPNVVSAGGAVTLGVGYVREARYFRRGKWCKLCMRLYTGTTGFSGSTGQWSFSIPFKASAATTIVNWGTGSINAHGKDYNIMSRIDPGASGVALWALWYDVGNANTNQSVSMEAVRNADPGGALNTGIPRQIGGVYLWDATYPGYANVDIDYYYDITQPIASTP